MSETEGDQADNVIKFTTRPEREAAADQAYVDAAEAEALQMLEDTIALLKAQQGRKVTGVVIALSFSDRCYASHIPHRADNQGSLLAAIDDAHYRFMKFTNGD